MVRTQVSFDRELYRRAQKYALQHHISLAELCRRGLRAALVVTAREDDRPWMRFAGMFASGDPDASTTVDDIVYGREEP